MTAIARVTPGWIDIDGPSPAHVLSYSTAKILVQKSPLHAKLRKDRVLDEDESEDEKREKETGSTLHAMLLGKGRRVVVLPFDNYRTKAAQESRDNARAEGAIPVLHNREPWLTAQTQKIRRRLEGFGITLDGEREAGAEWIEEADDGDEIECRGALDLWQPSTRTIFDLKFTRSAHPDACRKQIYQMAYDIQAAAYTSAAETIERELAGRVRFVILFCEVASAAVTPVLLAGDYAHLGRLRWRRAVNVWARCLREERWPGYVDRPVAIDAPAWALEAEMAAQGAETERAWGISRHEQPAGNDAGEERHDHDAAADIELF
jgi:hypothetical protein